MLSLQNPYISIESDRGPSYGGSQLFSENHMLSRCGCGVIAAADALLYLARYHNPHQVSFLGDLPERMPAPLPCSAYNELIMRLRQRFFPLIPYLGINGVMLMTGMQSFFREYDYPYSARWCISRSRMWSRIERMLREDIPVIMSVGPNFPVLWGRHRACFYLQKIDGSLVPAAHVKAHYFTVTGMNDQWVRVSSWGRMLYLNRDEFETYVRENSAGFISNILSIESKR